MKTDELDRSISQLVTLLTLTIYFILSFMTGAWHLTWLVFPLAAAVKSLILAVMHTKGHKSQV